MFHAVHLLHMLSIIWQNRVLNSTLSPSSPYILLYISNSISCGVWSLKSPVSLPFNLPDASDFNASASTISISQFSCLSVSLCPFCFFIKILTSLLDPNLKCTRPLKSNNKLTYPDLSGSTSASFDCLVKSLVRMLFLALV